MTRPATILGAQYYRPPNPPREAWARDLARMRDAGMNSVKLWACWSWMDGGEGGTDFEDLDVLLDLAASVDLGVVVNVILEDAPYWLERARPQSRYTDEEGRAVALTAAMNTPGGGWPGLCFDDNGVWAAAAAFLNSVVERYREHPALRVWDVWNEPHMEPASYHPERLYCYCPASLRSFEGWLRERHGSLGRLNEAWARRYRNWSEVGPPRVFEAVPDMLDWREFWFANLRRWLERRAAIVRAADPSHPVMTHVALSGFTGQLATHTLDEFSLSGAVDVFGTSSFPTWLMGDDLVEHMMNLDTARDAAAGRPFWQAELQGGMGRRDAHQQTTQPRPDTVALWMWDALAAGAGGIMFWQWRPELLGPESPGYGLTTPSGDPTPRLEAVTAFADIAARQELAERVPDAASTALLLSRRTALLTFAADRHMGLYREAAMGAYRLLLDLDLPVHVLHEDAVFREGVPAHVERLYWPMPGVADVPLADALTAFVERGGRLVAEALPGEHGPDGRRQPMAPGFGLDALFGVSEVEPDADLLDIELAGGTLRGAWRRARVDTSVAVLGTFVDGRPGVTLRQTGSGRGIALHVATYPSVAYARERDAASRAALGELLDAAAVRRPLRWVQPAPGLVGRGGRTADGRRLAFALNWTDEDAAATFDVAARVVRGPLSSDRLAPAGTGIAVPARSAVLLVEA